MIDDSYEIPRDLINGITDPEPVSNNGTTLTPAQLLEVFQDDSSTCANDRSPVCRFSMTSDRDPHSVQLFGHVHAHAHQRADSGQARGVRALPDTSGHRRNDRREGVL